VNGNPGRFYISAKDKEIGKDPWQGEEGIYIEFLKFVEPWDCERNQIRILRSQCNRILSPINLCCNTAISRNIFCKINPMREQKHPSEFQLRVCRELSVSNKKKKVDMSFQRGGMEPAGFQTWDVSSLLAGMGSSTDSIGASVSSTISFNLWRRNFSA